MAKLSLDNRAVNILNHIHAGVLYCRNDEHSTILYANDYFYQMIGYEKDEFAILFANRFADLVMDDVSHILKNIDWHIEQGLDLDYEYRMRNKQGDIFWVHDTAKYEAENNCWYVTIMDITEMKSLEYERKRLEFYLDSMPNKIVICDQNANIIYKNRCAEECAYYQQDASSLHQLIGGHILGKKLDEIMSQSAQGQQVDYEVRFSEQGTFVGHDRNRMIPIRDTEGDILNYMQVSEDLLSISDGLTHFPTRTMFEQYYESFIKAHPEQTVYMVIVDVDDFKSINDTYGHQTGDEVIRATGRRLTATLGAEDYVCRFGGDEFILLFVNQDLDGIQGKCQYVLNSTNLPLQGKEKDVKVTYSIGIAGGSQAPDYAALLEQADKALYQVKQNGKGGLMVYQDEEASQQMESRPADQPDQKRSAREIPMEDFDPARDPYRVFGKTGNKSL